MIFGNSEIRLRFKEEAVYCNFAIQNAYFNNGNHTVDALLMNGINRNGALLDFEWYQIQFK